MKAHATIIRSENWEDALAGALSQVERASPAGEAPDLVLLFASTDFISSYPVLVARAYLETRAKLLIGCSSQAIIGTGQEIEGESAISMLALWAPPGTSITPFYFTQEQIEQLAAPEKWWVATGKRPEEIHAWLLLADPFRLDGEALLAGLSDAYPKLPLIGGMASGEIGTQMTHLFFNNQVYSEGCIGVAIGGALTVHTIVSQGAQPIGEPWTITAVYQHLIQTISQRPAIEVLRETLQALPPELQHRAQRNLLVGLAINEYKDTFERGDFLIRNIMGIDRRSGALAIGAMPRVGQTLQFQLRDAGAADEELRSLLTLERRALGDQRPLAAMLCSCNGRGTGLFGTPDHDASAIAEELGTIPLAGFFCSGEIGPIGQQPFLHGYTASIALLVPTATP